jgi:hypothetical protein
VFTVMVAARAGRAVNITSKKIIHVFFMRPPIFPKNLIYTI